MTTPYNPTHDPATRAKLERLRAEVGAEDPEILGWDIDDPKVAMGLLLMDAIHQGAAVRMERTDEAGHSETVSFTNMGRDASGNVITTTSFTSSDGTLSPDMAEVAAQALQPQLDAEMRNITDQQ